jgi:hypothetical protein
MAQFRLSTASFSAAWRAAQPEIPTGTLLSVEALSDSYARRLVARAKRRWELTMNQQAGAISNQDNYIATACQSGVLKGFCFVAADEIAEDLCAHGADAKCVRVQQTTGGGDHYFTVVNKGSVKDSLIVDATWLQFAMTAFPFCLVGTLKKLTPSVNAAQPTIELVDAYRAGLQAVDQWASYSCFT